MARGSGWLGTTTSIALSAAAIESRLEVAGQRARAARTRARRLHACQPARDADPRVRRQRGAVIELRRREIPALRRHLAEPARLAGPIDPSVRRVEADAPRLLPQHLTRRPPLAAGVGSLERQSAAYQRLEQTADLEAEIGQERRGRRSRGRVDRHQPSASRAATRTSRRRRVSSAAASPRITRRETSGSSTVHVRRSRSSAAIW